jgi:hypothetical protein
MTTPGPAPPAPRADRVPTFVAAGLAVLAAASFAIDPVAWAAGHLREGFPGYFTAARLVAEGRWTSRVYDDRFFANETLEVTDRQVGEIYRPNPPVAALLMLPLTGLDLLTARRAWLALEVVLVAVTWLLLQAAIPGLRAPPIALSVLALVLVWAPLRVDVSMGQVYVPLLALHAAALLALQRGGGWLAGLALGAATGIKLAALPWLIVAAVRRDGRLVAAAVVTIAALVAGTLAFAGTDGWTAFGTVAWSDLTADRPSLAVSAYQSTAGLLRHLLAPDATWNPGAVADLPKVARALGFALGAWVVVVTILLARRARADLAAALAVTAFVLGVNVAQEYTHTLLVLPAAVAIGRALEPPLAGRGRTAWLAIAIALLAAPLPYRDPAFADGWMALLAYPRVYGAWLLWAWLARDIGLELRWRSEPARDDAIGSSGDTASVSEPRR